MSLGRLRGYGRAAYMTFKMTLRQNVMDGFIIFTVLIQPLIIAAMALWMLQDSIENPAIFIIVGSGLTGLWSSLLFVSGNSITTERWTGTLEMLVGQPTPFPIIVFGKNLAHVSQSLGSMIVAYILAVVIFGLQLTIGEPTLFVIAIGFTVVAFVCFGLVVAPIFVMNPGVQGWQNSMEFPIFILSGFLFSIALLPGWTTPFSYILAPYWAARALHGASSGGASTADILFSFGMLILFSVIYLIIAAFLFHKLLIKARSDATLAGQ